MLIGTVSRVVAVTFVRLYVLRKEREIVIYCVLGADINAVAYVKSFTLFRLAPNACFFGVFFGVVLIVLHAVDDFRQGVKVAGIF